MQDARYQPAEHADVLGHKTGILLHLQGGEGGVRESLRVFHFQEIREVALGDDFAKRVSGDFQ